MRFLRHLAFCVFRENNRYFIKKKNMGKLNKLFEDESILSVSIVSTNVGKTKESCVNLTKKSVLRAPKIFTKILR